MNSKRFAVQRKIGVSRTRRDKKRLYQLLMGEQGRLLEVLKSGGKKCMRASCTLHQLHDAFLA